MARLYVTPHHWAWIDGAFNGWVIDTIANCIVGWNALRCAKTDFVLDTVKQALDARRLTYQGGLIHHRDREAKADWSDILSV